MLTKVLDYANSRLHDNMSHTVETDTTFNSIGKRVADEINELFNGHADRAI